MLAFTGETLSVTQIMISGCQHLLFLQCFQKPLFSEPLKKGDCVAKGYCNTAKQSSVFNPFTNEPWLLRVCSISLLKTLREKEKLLVTSNFSFSHSVFYLFGEIPAIFIQVKAVVCKPFQFG